MFLIFNLLKRFFGLEDVLPKMHGMVVRVMKLVTISPVQKTRPVKMLNCDFVTGRVKFRCKSPTRSPDNLVPIWVSLGKPSWWAAALSL